MFNGHIKIQCCTDDSSVSTLPVLRQKEEYDTKIQRSHITDPIAIVLILEMPLQ